VRGDFRRADPERGRFRDFVKTAVYHLVVDFQKQRRRRLPPIPQDAAEPVATADAELDLDRQFLAGWREELLARAWDVLAETEPTQHAVLRFRAEHPDLPSPEMAERLSKQLGRPFTATAVRVTLHRARERFAGLLLDEVVRSLQSASREQIEHELIDLGLWDYCRAAFQQCGP
jgi:RNA polymerase sigma-70 factor (ECF subfamily)